MSRSGSYVTGRRGRYQVQPPVVHPAWCPCEKCIFAAEQGADRDEKQVHRVRRVSKYPDSKTDSATYALLVKQQEEQRLAQLVAASKQPKPGTLEGVIETFFTYNPRKVSEATIERDRISANNLVRILGKNTNPETIDEPAALEYRAQREKEGARPRTILNELNFLLGVLRAALRWESRTGVHRIVLHEVPDVGDWESDSVAFTPEEFGRVLAVLDDVNRRRCIFGVTTMVRRTPLVGMKAEYINVSDRWLMLPAEIMKKGRSKRRSPLSVPICAWAAEQVADLEPNEHGYLWPSRLGTPLTRLRDIFEAASTAAGVPDFSCHDLRTTGSTWLRNRGVDELVLAILLGHRSTFDPDRGSFQVKGGSVTSGYTKILAGALREAVAVFDEIRKEIDPPAAENTSAGTYESEPESAGVLSGWDSRGLLVAHTGFEPVLPP